MPLDRLIEKGIEKRKPYRKSKAVDPSCRNHGGCPLCRDNRLYANTKRLEAALDKIEEVNTEDSMEVDG